MQSWRNRKILANNACALSINTILNPPIGVDYEKQSKQERQVVRDSAQVPRGDVHSRAQIHLREGGKARRKGLLDSRRFWGFDHGDRVVLPSKYPSKGYNLSRYIYLYYRLSSVDPSVSLSQVAICYK